MAQQACLAHETDVQLFPMPDSGKVTEQEIDRIVVAQADDDAAWEQPVRVQRAEPALLTLPPDLIARAVFLAQPHRTKNAEE